MKIGIDVRCLGDKNYSGVSYYTLHMLRSLFASDGDNEYVLFYNSSKKVALPYFPQKNVKYVAFSWPNKIFNILVRYCNWPKIDRLIGGVDVFFMPNANFIALSKKCKKILAVHDLSFIKYPEFFNWPMRLWHGMVFKKNISLANSIVADSENTKKDICEIFNVDSATVSVIHLGVGEEFKRLDSGDPRLSAIRLKYNLPEKFILYLGTIEPRKNIESIIEAYKSIESPNFDLVIAGGVGWNSDYIFKMARGHRRIHFIGYIDDRVALYNAASCLVYPSYYEGFGLPIIESMACGCPVICGHNSSQGEVAGDAALCVDAYNVNEIKTAITLLMGDTDLRTEYTQRGYARALDFSWQKSAESLREILK